MGSVIYQDDKSEGKVSESSSMTLDMAASASATIHSSDIALKLAPELTIKITPFTAGLNLGGVLSVSLKMQGVTAEYKDKDLNINAFGTKVDSAKRQEIATSLRASGARLRSGAVDLKNRAVKAMLSPIVIDWDDLNIEF